MPLSKKIFIISSALLAFFLIFWGIYSFSFKKAAAPQAGTPRKFLAALFTGLPAYVSFLFRIVLTVMLILSVSWITMSFTPRAQEE